MNRNPYLHDPKAVRALLAPFLQLDILSWRGLVDFDLDTLTTCLGQPDRTEQTDLGWYPAQCLHYTLNAPSKGLKAYFRDREIILIESEKAPLISILKHLGEPCGIKPHEILIKDFYVHEYVYCQRGLVLSVAEPFRKGKKKRIIRCRGIKPLENPDQFGPEFYQSFEAKTSWDDL